MKCDIHGCEMIVITERLTDDLFSMYAYCPECIGDDDDDSRVSYPELDNDVFPDDFYEIPEL